MKTTIGFMIEFDGPVDKLVIVTAPSRQNLWVQVPSPMPQFKADLVVCFEISILIIKSRVSAI